MSKYFSHNKIFAKNEIISYKIQILFNTLLVYKKCIIF